MIKTFAYKYTILFCILISIITLSILLLLNQLSPYIIGETGYYYYSFFTECIAASIALLFLYYIGFSIKSIGLQKGGFWKGIGLGTIMFFYDIITIIVYANGYQVEHFIFPKFFPLIGLMLMMFSVGFFEELFYRGLILQIMLRKWKWKRKKNI